MSQFDSRFLQGALFTGTAVLFILLSAWWLYLSPMKRSPQPAQALSAPLAGWLAGLLGLAALLWVSGGLWDASMHIKTGEIPAGADFLWPPHLLLYSGFLLSFLVALFAILKLARAGWRSGLRDPRQWVRRSPFLGAVALASLYELMAIPGDALWHEIFGEDLTAWSPPHVLLALMTGVVIVCAVGLLVQARFKPSLTARRDTAILLLLGLMLNLVYMLGVLEWELPDRPALVDARPLWLYPLVGGAAALFTLVLARRLVSFRWAATGAALAFYLVRIPLMVALGLTDNVTPALPLVFILGAILLDTLPLRKITPPFWRWLAVAAVFTAGYSVLALPLLALRTNLRLLSQLDILLAVITTLLAGLAVTPLAEQAGRALRNRETPDDKSILLHPALRK